MRGLVRYASMVALGLILTVWLTMALAPWVLEAPRRWLRKLG